MIRRAFRGIFETKSADENITVVKIVIRFLEYSFKRFYANIFSQSFCENTQMQSAVEIMKCQE